jgi:ABC-type amino acid transport substrate-binding protein
MSTLTITRGGAWLLAGALALVSQASLAGPVLDRIKNEGRIIIAHRVAAVPFSYLDADKKPVGYAVDLCLKIAEAVRKNLQMKSITPVFMPVAHPDNITAIAEGKADMECGPTTNNAERRKKVAFTVPHYITGARFMVKADSGLTDLKTFEGKRIVSTKGSTSFKVVDKANREGLLGIKVLEAPDRAQAVKMVETGEADGFAMDDVLLYGVIAESPDPSKLKVVGKFLTIEPLAIMLPKTDEAFKKMVDDEMKRMIYSKEAHALFERWFMTPIPPKNISLNLPMNYLLKDFWKYPTDVVPF